ncbi:hypothetical protein [Micromonospora aurantiaca (nom. illeg.)]|uniref:hypothetical protein n=1 Tax=Micromonospora aurantiaca (nom. illeg.) TaxID=47850 RepID=UPI0033D37E1E
MLNTTTETHPVAHATTPDGEVLIAVRHSAQAWSALTVAGEGAEAELAADDVRPYPESPWLGRALARGRLRPIPRHELRRAGLEFASVNPLADLLDLGTAVGLFRLDLTGVRLVGREVVAVDPDAFAAADPDPLHLIERELLEDLRLHHRAEIASLTTPPGQGDVPVRLDRYGLVLALPGLRRIEFPTPADCPSCVSRMLHLSHTNHP